VITLERFFLQIISLTTIKRLLQGVVIVCASVFVGTGFGQEVPKAVLVDEHGQLACDDSLGRLDVFYAELAKNPGDRGLFVISGRPEIKHRVAFREGLIEAHTRDRGVDAGRFDFVRAVSDGDLMVQYWRIPPGADRPVISNVDKTYSLPSSIKPFMLGAEYSSGDGICPEVNDFPIFVKFLKDNPEARGNIVVRERTLGRAEAKGRRVVRELGAKGIARSRIRVFTGTRGADDHNVPVVEYWFLP
jgi:hypothetical protein